MIRAIAKQAEAERDRRAKIIHAEAEFQASQTLVNAAKILSSIPAAMQLRYLQNSDRNRRRAEFDCRLSDANRHHQALPRTDREARQSLRYQWRNSGSPWERRAGTRHGKSHIAQPGRARLDTPATARATFFRSKAGKLGCECIVSKRLGSPYRSGRSTHWVKVKNRKAPAVTRGAEED
jgi:hypothetical protein